MQMIYNNFDGLDISFQGALPEKILKQLGKAREQAQKEKRAVTAYIGLDKSPVIVAENGAKGGYRYRFDTGLDGETWFVAHSTNSKLWNIRVSVKSLQLALTGYEAVKNQLINRLINFEAMGISAYEPEVTGKVNRLFLPLERISRFDYCFDFVMESAYQPVPGHFVAHQRAKKHVYGERLLSDYSASNGDKTNTIRIGEMPGRQIAMYNKTKEIIASSKQYWWDIWGIDPMPFKNGEKQIWRIEVRAGRNELDKWPLKRFAEFNDKAGDVIVSILKAIRYTNPINDQNRSRWPIAPLWQETIDTADKALAPYRTSAIRENVIRDYRANVINGYDERLIGNLIGKTAAQGRDISELSIVAEELEALIEAIVRKDKKSVIEKFERAEEKFRLLI